MNTAKLKLFSWKNFEKTQTWKIIFLVFDSIFRVITLPIFVLFTAIFENHIARTEWGFYGPMIVLLVGILFFITIPLTGIMSWYYIVLIDVLVAVFLILCVWYPCWSEDYREKMGYPKMFD